MRRESLNRDRIHDRAVGVPRAGGILVVAFAACSQASLDSEYADPGGAFRIAYPAGWQVAQDRRATVFRPSSGESSVAVTAAPRNERGQVRTLAAAHEALRTQYRLKPGFAIVGEKHEPFRGWPSVVIEATAQWKGAAWRKRQRVIEAGADRLVYFDCNAAAAGFAAFVPLCFAIEESLEVFP